MIFFAYDDKMFSPVIRSILPKVRCLGAAKVMGYHLYFHNLGHSDHSGKCNLIQDQNPEQAVFGVLYEIKFTEKPLLDEAECLGLGNQEVRLLVEPVQDPNSNNQSCSAFTYVAHKDNVYEDLVPFSWYKALVVSGAREHHLPEAYIHHLQQVAATKDTNYAREHKYIKILELFE